MSRAHEGIYTDPIWTPGWPAGSAATLTDTSKPSTSGLMRVKLPNREQAHIPPKKLTGYLLSETHPVGESKARVLRAAGFDNSSADALAEELIRIAQSEDVTSVVESPFGTKYAVDGTVTSPLGQTVAVRTVWILESASDRPRFVTAYPK